MSRSSLAEPADTPIEEPPSAPRRARRPTAWHALYALCGIAAAAQFALLVARSLAQWRDFALTVDFATFNQAWWSIGHGHLGAFDTIGNHPFWQDQFNLAFFPLALLEPLTRSAFALLVAQDLAIAGATLVAGAWVVDALVARCQRAPAFAAFVTFGVLVSLVVDPWAFEAAYFDFHAEPFAALLLLLAARALWRGRRFSPFVFAFLAMTTCTAGATLAFGLGLGAAVSARRLRHRGWLLMLGALGYVGVVVALGANKGTLLGPTYGYLAGHGPVANNLSGALAIGRGVLGDPKRAALVLWSKRWYLDSIFTAGGVVGVATGWGAALALLDVLGEGLNSSPDFVSMVSGGFQNYPVVPFLVVGSALLTTWLIARTETLGRAASRALVLGAWLLAAAAMSSSLTLAVERDGQIPSSWLTVPSRSAHALALVASEIRPGWEVVASQGVVGRFAGRRYVYAFAVAGGSVPLRTRPVAFVITPLVGIETVPVHEAAVAERMLVTRYHAQVKLHRDGVFYALVTPRRAGAANVELPPPARHALS